MNKTLTKRQYLILGSLLFGLFFGAGNLIFPIHLGQLSAGNWGPATIGFLLTAILLPLLSILAISLTRSNSAYDLALPAGKKFALFFLILIHLTLGILVPHHGRQPPRLPLAFNRFYQSNLTKSGY